MAKQSSDSEFLSLVFRLTTALVGSVVFFIAIAYFLHTSPLISGALIAVGACLGFYLVYREIQKEDKK